MAPTAAALLERCSRGAGTRRLSLVHMPWRSSHGHPAGCNQASRMLAAARPCPRLPAGLQRLSLANNAFAELPDGLAACSRCAAWRRCCCIPPPAWAACFAIATRLGNCCAAGAGPACSSDSAIPALPTYLRTPCPHSPCSLRDLTLTGNAIVLTQRAAERLTGALTCLEHLRLNPLPPHPAAAGANGTHDGGTWHEHGKALAHLVQQLRWRLEMTK